MSSTVRLERREGLALVTLDCSETANALTPEMAKELDDVCTDIDADRTIGAAVVRSTGPVFCAGAHRALIDSWRQDPLDERNYEAIATIYGAFARIAELKVPSVAAVRGAVVGGGVNLMLVTDVRIIATTTRIASGFLKMGFHPGGGHYALLGRVLPREAVAAVGLFNEEITGVRAVELGLAWQALPEEEVEDRAIELAMRISNSPVVTRMALASMRHEIGPPRLPLAAAMEVERAAQLYSLRH